jgi:hypothetical protein
MCPECKRCLGFNRTPSPTRLRTEALQADFAIAAFAKTAERAGLTSPSAFRFPPKYLSCTNSFTLTMIAI